MKAKLENFFFYYKFHMLAVLFVLVVIVVLVKDDKRVREQKQPSFVIVDETSQMNLTRAKNMMADFAKQSGLNDEEMGFYYRSMYLEQDDYQEISFGLAGIEAYEDYINEGVIDILITTANQFEGETNGEGEEIETAEVLSQQFEVANLEEYFTKDELERYKNKLYYVDDKPVGIIFNKCDKAEEFFEDSYPTEYHYILRISKASEKDENVKKFIEYLL